VASPARDSWSLSVSPATFATQMALVAESYRPVAISELVEGLRRGRVADRSVAITFDDGYVDNLDRAVPVLERLGVPATIYVASGYVGSDAPFWWDEVEDLLVGSGAREERLELRVGDRELALATGTPAEREAALSDGVQPALRETTPEGIERALRALRAWAGRPAEPRASEETGRAVRPEDLARLERSEMIEVGAHTRRHPSLRALSPAAARAEIAGSRDDLERLLGRPPLHFSYPFGDRRRVTPRLVEEERFTTAVAVEQSMPVTYRSDRFALARSQAVEEDIARFEARLAQALW